VRISCLQGRHHKIVWFTQFSDCHNCITFSQYYVLYRRVRDTCKSKFSVLLQRAFLSKIPESLVVMINLKEERKLTSLASTFEVKDCFALKKWPGRGLTRFPNNTLLITRSQTRVKRVKLIAGGFKRYFLNDKC
jgi:hypothetical protein